MRNRFIASLALACLVAITFAAGATAEVVNRSSAASRMSTEGGLTRFMGPPIKIEVCEQEPFNDGATGVADLIAGQYYDVGDVYFEAFETVDGTFLRVTYQTTGDWHLTEYHVYVGDDPPEKSAPGQFPYGGEVPAAEDMNFVLEVPFPGGCQIVAAHAVVEDRSEPIFGDDFDLDEFALSLPDCAEITGDNPAADLMAYFDIGVTDTSLLGEYYGWCVDTDRSITVPFDYLADVWSSYETLPDGLIEFPENLDLVNWILNQEIVGTSSICGGDYTYGDVQRAIWALVDNGQATGGLGPWSQCRADEIEAAALLNGEGFEPGCGDFVGVILVPVLQCGGPWDFQFIIIGVPAECDVTYGDETAWAKADGPVGSDQLYDCGWATGWGSYMEFCYDF